MRLVVRRMAEANRKAKENYKNKMKDAKSGLRPATEGMAHSALNRAVYKVKDLTGTNAWGFEENEEGDGKKK